MMAYVDYAFWFNFLVPLIVGGVGAWMLRGEWERARGERLELDRWRLMRELEDAKRRHPAYKIREMREERWRDG